MSLQAFDVELAGNLSAILPGQTAITYHISSLEVCSDFLYIGTKEGLLLKSSFFKDSYNLHQKISLRKAAQSLVLKAGPVIQLKALSALNQLLVLAEESLVVIDLEGVKLNKNLKFKNVTSFYVNENPPENDPFSVELCIAGKKKIYLVKLSRDQCKVIKEFFVNATPSNVVVDSETICFAMGSEYYLLNSQTEEIQELFSRDDIEQPPIIFRIFKDEFLLCGPGGLGVFVCGQGFSDKLPIHFPEAVTALTYSHPYVVALCGNNLHFFSTIDQRSKQVIAISNVRCLINGDGQMFASTAIDVFALHPISTDVQLEKLIKEARLEEALLLAKNVYVSSNDKERHMAMLQSLQNQVALKRFSAGQFFEFLEFTNVNSVEPHWLTSINFKTTFPVENLRREALECFVEFLERSKKKHLESDALKVVDTALLEQYALRDNAGTKLQDLVEKCQVNEEKLVGVLETHGRYHSLAVHYTAKDKLENALEIWEKLLKGSLKDVHFPGEGYVAEKLAKTRNSALIWRFSQEILIRDEALGSTIFMELCENQPQLMRDRAIRFLHSFPTALKLLLEFLYNQNPEEESLANQLVEHYINEINAARSSQKTSLHAATMNKLRSVLRTSHALNLRQVSLLFNDEHFPHERAIICGRLGNHVVALEIFINQLKDFDAAEEYCGCVGSARAWNELLSVCIKSQNCLMYERIVDIFRRRPEEFDIASALLLLPDSASLSSIQPALSFALRDGLHRRRMKTIEKSLNVIDKISSIQQLNQLERLSFKLKNSSYCTVCKKQFKIDEGFACYPNGILVHKSCCSSLHICPLSGFLFKICVVEE